jgi:hypothetical protein
MNEKTEKVLNAMLEWKEFSDWYYNHLDDELREEFKNDIAKSLEGD